MVSRTPVCITKHIVLAKKYRNNISTYGKLVLLLCVNVSKLLIIEAEPLVWSNYTTAIT